MTQAPGSVDLIARLVAAQPPRLVLDTNVIMALWHFEDPRLVGLQAWIEARQAVLLTRAECLDELHRVLAYPQFGIAPERQAQIADAYAMRAECLPSQTVEQLAAAAGLPQCKDRDDQKFLTLALDGAAHALLSRDKLLLGLARRAPYRDHFFIATPERVQTAVSPVA
ncbi:MAG: putative toxin-antitoxin system toxin component, PIN family [Rhodocyclaceae bacterium]